MNLHPRLLHSIEFAALLAFASVAALGDEEQDLLAVLRSQAGIAQKCAACQRLRVIGTPASVPALAALLGEEGTSHAARYALEGLPFPEAGDALRRALETTSAALKVGVVDSIGWRRDIAAVPSLVRLASDADPGLASAAAAALGRIGGPEAIAALQVQRDAAPSEVRPAVWDSLLLCAQRLGAAGDVAGTLAVCRDLEGERYPNHVRAAAWRCRVLVDSAARSGLLVSALAGPGPFHKAALDVVRELDDARAVTACLERWPVLPEDAQLAVLDAVLKARTQALPTVRSATESPYPAVRLAAWQALGDVGEASCIPALAKAAAAGDRAQRAAARDSLARLSGPGVRSGLMEHLGSSPPEEQAELLRVLGERGDTDAARVLLDHAGSGPEPVRLAALESLRQLAVAETLPPLLDLVLRADSVTRREAVLRALYALCQASRDKDRAVRDVVAVLRRAPAAQRGLVLPLLAELATPAAFEAAEAATRDPDNGVALEAVRVLAGWPNASPAPRLLEVAGGSADPTLQTLALRGFIAVASQEPDSARRLELLQQAMAAARRPDEKKQAIGQVGQIPTPDALDVALAALADPAVASEAGLAAVAIAERLVAGTPVLGFTVATNVLAHCKSPEVVTRAWALRGKVKAAGPFIQDWVVAGPFSRAGASSALDLFDEGFDPEKAGNAVTWKPVPRADMVDLLSLFPGQVNCAAYLRARIVAPAACEAVLLVGSDDGVKGWVNGTVVLRQNVDRGAAPDQDMAPVQLRQGPNELLLKITQGGGGWAACARIVGADGLPIPGLDTAPPGGR